MSKIPLKIIILTHHKTGTVFWSGIIKKLIERFDLNLLRIERKFSEKELNNFIKGNWDICHQTHSSCSLGYVKNIDYRCVHSVRNSANIIVSALKYHKFNKDEKWLHKKREDFGGLSYQEKILKLKNFEEELIFEMNNSAGKVIKNIEKINKNSSHKILNVDLDIISFDKEMKDFKNLFYFLKLNYLDNFTIEDWINLGKKKFLWNIKNPDNSPHIIKHVTRDNLLSLLDQRNLFGKNARYEFKRIFGNKIFNETFKGD